MWATKLCTAICALTFAAMVVGAHERSQFFPWPHLFVRVAAVGLFGGLVAGDTSIGTSTVLAVVLAVSLRLFIFEWPASMIGMDPDKYAGGIRRITQTESLTIFAEIVPTHRMFSEIPLAAHVDIP